MKSSRHYRAQLAHMSRRDVAATAEQLECLRREYRAARLAEHIERVVTDTETFTEPQLERLKAAINGGVMA